MNIKIDPEFQKIKAHSIGSYMIYIDVSSEIQKGEYLIEITAYARRGIIDIEKIKLVIN